MHKINTEEAIRCAKIFFSSDEKYQEIIQKISTIIESYGENLESIKVSDVTSMPDWNTTTDPRKIIDVLNHLSSVSPIILELKFLLWSNEDENRIDRILEHSEMIDYLKNKITIKYSSGNAVDDPNKMVTVEYFLINSD